MAEYQQSKIQEVKVGDKIDFPTEPMPVMAIKSGIGVVDVHFTAYEIGTYIVDVFDNGYIVAKEI